MNGTAFEGGPSDRCASAGKDHVAPPVFADVGAGSITGGDPKYLTVCPREQSRVCVCKPRRVLDEGFEHRPKIEARPADDFQDLGGGGLLLERLCKIPRPRLHLLKQSRVFNRDHGLVRKGIDELDLTFGEWAHFGAPNDDHPNCLACVDQRDGEQGAKTELKRGLVALGIFIRFSQHVRDLDRSPVDNGSPHHVPTRKGKGAEADRAGGKLCTWAATRRRDLPSTWKIAASYASQRRAADSTRASSTFCTSSADRLMTFKTSAVAVCCSRLSVSSRLLACSASNSRAFSMAMTAWSANDSTSATCLSSNGAIRVRDSLMPPMGSPFNSRGAARPVWILCARFKARDAATSSGSVATSSTWTARRASVARPTMFPRLKGTRTLRTDSSSSSGWPRCATTRNVPPLVVKWRHALPGTASAPSPRSYPRSVAPRWVSAKSPLALRWSPFAGRVSPAAPSFAPAPLRTAACSRWR